MLGRLLDGAYDEEFGAETADQSALNLVYLLGDQPSGAFSLYGPSDDRYHLAGGNQQLPQRIAEHLTGTGLTTIATGKRLNTLALNRDSTVGLWFDGSSSPVVVDHAILCMSFAVLRTLDVSHGGFDARKRQAITQLGAGRNAKLQLQFDERYWYRRGPLGRLRRRRLHGLRDPERLGADPGQPGKTGILVDYAGGDLAGAFGRRGRTRTRATTAGEAVRAGVPDAARAGFPGHLAALERPRDPVDAVPRPEPALLVRVLAGRAVHGVQRLRAGRHRAARSRSTSRASIARSTSRVTWRAAQRRGPGPPRRCSAPSSRDP